MKSPNIIRARVIAITLLLAVAVFGFGTAAYAKPARSAVKPEAASKAAAAPCLLSVTPLSHTSPGSGDSFQVQVTVLGAAGCSHSVYNSPQWIKVTNAGNSPLYVTVYPNLGALRTGSFTIKGLYWSGGSATLTGVEYTVTVTQPTISCSYSFDKTSANLAGNTSLYGFINVTASAPACPRNATSSASWLKILSGANFNGSGPIEYKAEANSGPPRVGKIALGNATFTVTQGDGCSYIFSPTGKNFAAGGGTGSINITASSSACPRNPTSNANWITITSGPNLTGSGPVNYTVAANNGPARSGEIKLGIKTHTVTQDAVCSATISPTSAQIPAAGGGGAVTVNASSAICSFFVQSLVPWIKASQVVNGEVNYTVDLNPGPQRDGIISIAGKTFQITQAGGCDYTLSPSIFNFQSGNGVSSIQVKASSSFCAWSPSSGASWVKITSAAQMKGDGTVNFTVDPNPGVKRETAITIGNKTATINQFGANCSFTISPGSQNFGVNGGEVNVNVTASSASCPWSAVASSPFISVVSGASGVGNGVTKIKVQPNASGARSGSAEIAGKTFGVTQDGVNAQALTITNLSPGFAAKGGKDFSLVVKGTNFTSACRVRWKGEERPTAFINNSTLAATISANDIADEGAFDVTVSNPNSGAESNAEQFMVYGAAAHVSSASFKGDWLAPNSMVSAFGVDLATQLKSADSQPLPTELGGSTVTITDSMGKESKAQLFFISPGQVNYLMPEGVALGKATVMIKSGSGHTSVGTVEITQVAPALFTANANGQGIVSAVALRVKANGQQVYEQVAQYDAGAGAFIAKPIDVSAPGEQVYLIFFGTGLRYRNSLNTVSLEIGGSFINALYAGAAPGFVGLDQINALAPNSLAGRGEVDVTLTVDGKKANTVKLMFK